MLQMLLLINVKETFICYLSDNIWGVLIEENNCINPDDRFVINTLLGYCEC